MELISRFYYLMRAGYFDLTCHLIILHLITALTHYQKYIVD